MYPCQNTVSMGRVVTSYLCGLAWREHDTQLILIRRLVVLLTSPIIHVVHLVLYFGKHAYLVCDECFTVLHNVIHNV